MHPLGFRGSQSLNARCKGVATGSGCLECSLKLLVGHCEMQETDLDGLLA